MRIHLARTMELKKQFTCGEIIPEDIYVLESFYSMEDWQRPLLNRFKGFLLDSGAFTFLNTAKTVSNVDFENYADRYADFIKENQIKRYFELDIDSIVGLKETERLRKRIENRCGVPCIPVWHKNRGKEYFISMCKDYDYVALGGVVIKEIPLSLFEKMFPWFIGKAHENGAQIHGLGYTKTQHLSKYHFDSVDSSTWTCSRRFGCAYWFNNGRIIQREVNKNRRLKDTTSINWHSFKEWVQFQRYAERNL